MADASDPRLTEERLRTYVLDQPSRERMCLELLALDSDYSSVRPRRPKGGPDGGRDIEALYKGAVVACGAVAWKTNARDEASERAEIAAKFTSDLNAAMATRPEMGAFVFFTNVDLLPSEKTELEAIATSKNIDHVDIRDREVLRLALDNAGGLLIRLRYLDLPMSKDEQLALIASFGRVIAEAVESEARRTSAGLARVEFRQARTDAVRSVDLIVHLREEATAAELGRFAVLMIVGDTAQETRRLYIANLSQHIANRSMAPMYSDVDGALIERGAAYGHEFEDQLVIAAHQLVWSAPPFRLHADKPCTNRRAATGILRTSGETPGIEGFSRIDDFAHKDYLVLVTPNLVERVMAIAFCVNEWCLFGLREEMLVPLELRGSPDEVPAGSVISEWHADVRNAFANGTAVLQLREDVPSPFLSPRRLGLIRTDFALHTPQLAIFRPLP